MKKVVKGYKVFNSDWTCRGFQYEVGKTYEEDVEPSCCGRGFHFCKKISNCFSYYSFDPDNRVAEVEALGDVHEKGDKSCTNKIKIVREVSWSEVLKLANAGRNNLGRDNEGDRNAGNGNAGHDNAGHYNAGNGNAGDYNAGDDNAGHYNAGNRNAGNGNAGHDNAGHRNAGDDNAGHDNAGHYNAGNRNAGHDNAGDDNAGHRNAGHRNAGDDNAGHDNAGHYNAGNGNAGDYNAGDYNAGNRNAGDCNEGNGNAGHYNSGNHNAGIFNTLTPPMRIFDTEATMAWEEWDESQAKKILKRKGMSPWEYWWSGLSDEEKAIIKNIPNFDAKKFRQITGIEVEEVAE